MHAGQAPLNKAVTAPELVALCIGIDQALNIVAEARGRLTDAANRIALPPPTPVGAEGVATETAPHLDARLRAILARAERVGRELHEVADRLDAAV